MLYCNAVRGIVSIDMSDACRKCFAELRCQLLGVGELPEWTNNLAAAASRVGPGLQALQKGLLNPFGLNQEHQDKCAMEVPRLAYGC